MKLMFGEPRFLLASLPQNSLIHGSAVWSCREKVSLLSLTHIVEQNGGKETVPVLWRFLHRVRKRVALNQLYTGRATTDNVKWLNSC